ncbi:alpha-galactosidase [Nguyenibacter vanlangensis]|uniref:alpha-galactosidase n=1 Tax=Nguyenibacter vanlangensis TaxID=1216886 RepID=A0ABZ3CZN8_9PROT
MPNPDPAPSGPPSADSSHSDSAHSDSLRSDAAHSLALTRRTAWKLLGGLGSAATLASTLAPPLAAARPATAPAAPLPAASRPHPPAAAAGIPAPARAGEGGSLPTGMLRLDGTGMTLLLIRRATGLPEIAYWGGRLPDHLDAAALYAVRSPDTPDNGPDQWQPTITLLDTIGAWNFDLPGLVAARPDGRDWTALFQVDAIRQTPDELVIDASDALSAIGLRITLRCADNVLAASMRLSNRGDTPLLVERLVSGTFLLPAEIAALGVLHGAWAHEFAIAPMSLAEGGIVIESRRNRTHDHFPGIVAGLPATSRNAGPAWAAQLGWSGGHRLCAERMEDGRIRLTVGEYLHPGEGTLEPGAGLDTPTVYATYSADGFAGCARAFHAYARRHLLRWPTGQMKPRPVLLNSWEANQFDLAEDRLRQQIDIAARLGVERFVLDDGWFGARRNDRAGLGDWTPALALFPQGLWPLSDYVHARGMEFGLWFEPEMVNPDSDLYRAHPDWVLQVRGRPLLTSRNQLVLDISRPDVAGYLLRVISEQVVDARIDYIKWDFNRDLLAAADEGGRPAYRRQVLALYALWDKLHAVHSALEIESCASGGGRADWGALGHVQRVWTSDNTSAPDRLLIQDGAWHFLPPEITGCHISASPNWLDHRATSIDFRAAVALFGHLGLELDPTRLSTDEQDRLAAWIALHKRLRPVLHHGQIQFGEATPHRIVRGVTTPDGGTGIYLVAQRDWPPARMPSPVLLPGLSSDRRYRVTMPGPQALGGHWPSPAQQRLVRDGLAIDGALLRDAGLFLPQMPPQSAVILECQAL